MITYSRIVVTSLVFGACLVGCGTPTVEVPVDSDLGKAMKADNDNQMKGSATRTKAPKAANPDE